MQKEAATGELFLADDSKGVRIMYRENDTMLVNRGNILAFNEKIDWGIKRLSGGLLGALGG